MKTTEEKLTVLAEIAACLNQAHLTWALGASAMLYFHHLAEDFHDLDIMIVNEDAEQAKALLQTLGVLEPPQAGGSYQTKHFHEFIIDEVEVDLIGGFAIVADGIVHDCSLRPEDITGSVQVHGRTVCLQSLQAWQKNYALMGRVQKAELIRRALQNDPSLR